MKDLHDKTVCTDRSALKWSLGSSLKWAIGEKYFGSKMSSYEAPNSVNKINTCNLDWKCEQETKLDDRLILRNVSLSEISEENTDMERGGRWRPTDCQPAWRTAVILHLQDREQHLRTFIHYMIPFLKKQKADFTIFVVEQVGDTIFNRAQSMDAGFVEAQNFGDFDCFIFHDVDMLPINLCNLYRCETDGVRHLGISRNLTSPQIVHEDGTGGASALTKSQFIQINGFTTVFFGWGGEDDDAYRRIMTKNITLFRYHPEIANYYHLPHVKDKTSHDIDKSDEANTHWIYMNYDGLNSLTYKVVNVTQGPVLTRIQISMPGPKTYEQIMPHLSQKRKLFQDQLYRDLRNKTYIK